MRPDALTRFMDKIALGPRPAHRPELGPCWFWTGYVNPDGYGEFHLGGRKTLAHGAAWTLFRPDDPVPDGWQRDHLCHDRSACRPGPTCPHRACVNPWHQEAVPARVNNDRSGSVTAANARKTACAAGGHPLEGDNLYRHPRRPGHRDCLRCRRRRSAEWRRPQCAGQLELPGVSTVPAPRAG